MQMDNKPSYWNPVTRAVAVGSALFLLLGWQIGANIGTIAMHLFLPYFVDISRGVGSSGAIIFRALAFLLQAGLIATVIASLATREKEFSKGLIALAVILIIVYLLLLIIGYLLPRLH